MVHKTEVEETASTINLSTTILQKVILLHHNSQSSAGMNPTISMTGNAGAIMSNNEASITAALLRQQNEIQQANNLLAAASVQPVAASRFLTTAAHTLPPNYLSAAPMAAAAGMYRTPDGLYCDYARLPSFVSLPAAAHAHTVCVTAPPPAAGSTVCVPNSAIATARIPPSQPDQVREGRLTFPLKLHQILWDDSISHIISWMPHGRAWKVHDQNKFEKEVMPKYFDMTKYSSFSRQVTGWGFHRINRGPDKGGYYQEVSVNSLVHR